MSGADNNLKIAIIGSGPSGFYAAESLLRAERPVQVDMLERLPTPFGLVRSGVAPDHPKLKEVTKVYDRIARSDGFRFLGNVTVGRDVTVEKLRDLYHGVILACGAQTDRSMGIPGEDLHGSHAATEFVGWFNGHPDFRDHVFDLSGESAVIVGQGNVAADVCRILAKPVDELRTTDIGEHALDALAQSNIREIHIVGRRGPAQARFTPKELRELGEIPGAVALADSMETVKSLLSDLGHADLATRPGGEGLQRLLSERKTRSVEYDDWLRIDEAEAARGRPLGKPREKFTRVRKMLALTGNR